MFFIVRFFYRLFYRPLGWIYLYLSLPFSIRYRRIYQRWKDFPLELRQASRKPEFMYAPTRIWIHAASIGEFESVRWIVEDLLSQQDKSLLVTYSSPSLGQHLSTETELLSHSRFGKVFFPLDTMRYLKQIRRMYQPTHFVLLQYDYWPNLISCVIEEPPIPSRSILNYSPPAEINLTNEMKLSYQQKVLSNFTFIHQCAETPDRPVFSADLSLTYLFPHTRWLTVDVKPLEHLPPFLRFIGGNTYLSDISFLVALFGYVAPLHYQLIWVPHDTSPKNIRAIAKQLIKLCHRYSISFREHLSLSAVLNDSEPGVILVTQFGFLKHLYPSAYLAYVGGGFRGPGIHNVIEPLSWGCPIVCGPKIFRQPVARWALKMGFLKTAATAESFRSILGEYFTLGDTHLQLRKRILATQDSMRTKARELSQHLPIFQEATVTSDTEVYR